MQIKLKLTLHDYILLRMKLVFKNHFFKCLVSNWTNMTSFHPLEVVGRASDTQLQVGEK